MAISVANDDEFLTGSGANAGERAKNSASADTLRDMAVPPPQTSELRQLVRKKDWSGTALGPMESWPPALRMMVDTLLLNSFPLLLWWGPDYISIYNDAYRPILGEKHPDALGLPFREVWPEVAEVLRPLIDSPFTGGPPTWVEDLPLELNRHGFTEEAHFTVAYSPVPDDTAPRGIGGVLATVHEITEKIVGERRIAALRDLGAQTASARTAHEACALAAEALENHDKDIPFALLYLIDDEGKAAALVATSGLAEDEWGSLGKIAIENARGPSTWPFAEVQETKSSVVVEDVHAVMPRVPQGPWSDAADRAVLIPIRAATGQDLAGFLVAGVSPRLRLDEQYRSFLDLVAAQISSAIATARAYEEERRRADALAEIDCAKTVFFSNISHEFRTPLSLLLGPLSDALGGRGVMERDQLGLAHRNALRLLKLVNTLLDFSRIEAGRAEANRAATDLSAFTAELASNFRSACERAGLNLVVDCTPLPSSVYVDPDMWEKIVLNLLSNAFKFTFEGEIEVSLREVEGGARLTVRDTGGGIPAKEMPRLFERFRRIEGQKSRTHEGSGIGLALVLELVNLHDGTIDVESAEGRGTTFIVQIPFGARDLVASDTAHTLSSTSVRAEAFVQEAFRWLPEGEAQDSATVDDTIEAEEPLARHRSARVLLADDNTDMRQYVRRLLADRYDVVAVANGRAALAEIRNRRPDLVLTDVMMPEIDGIELLREIRADRTLQDLPVILLSARAGEESRVEGLQRGADDYLIKPFSARELIARVGANLELARVRAEATVALRESEGRYRDLSESLERRVESEVGERRRIEDALRQSQKMEAIGQLTGGLAHDFNNLLAAMSGSFSLIERRIADGKPGAERYIHAGMDAVRRAATLTQRLLAFSRQQTLDPKPVDANKLIAGMEELIRRTVGPSVDVSVLGDSSLWLTKIDASQLESALLNLCINARDAMAPDGGRLAIETANVSLDDKGANERDLSPGQYISLSVTDTGAGMTPEIIGKAFDPFFTTKPVGQGTGLGLSMVYGFVRQSGGQVRILSEIGKGTTMRLYLPRYMGGVEERDIANAKVVRAEAAHGESVLVVDDEPTLRMLMTDILEDRGFKVRTEKNGVSALEILESGDHFDLLVTDIGLPGGMSGRQLADEARKRNPNLKILFVTGFDEKAATGYVGLRTEVMTKPFAVEAFALKVRNLIDGR